MDTSMDYNLSGSVFATLDFVGFHRWKEAPDEVYYLRTMHRHLFKVRVEVSVEHNDREVEFHILRRRVADWIRDQFDQNEHHETELGASSCESLGLHILNFMRDTYPDRPHYRVEVSEDGESGSVVEARS